MTLHPHLAVCHQCDAERETTEFEPEARRYSTLRWANAPDGAKELIRDDVEVIPTENTRTARRSLRTATTTVENDTLPENKN